VLAKEKIVVISVWCGMDYRNDDKYDDKVVSMCLKKKKLWL